MKTIRIRSKILSAALPLAGICLFGCFDDDSDGVITGNGNGQASHAVAQVRGYADTAINGKVKFDLKGDSLVITAAIGGLVPGQTYGMHVHEIGDCSSPTSSGPVFSQTEPHGNPFDSLGTHQRGGLPNLQADLNGIGRLDFSTTAIDLRTTAESVLDRSVMIHSNPDDFISQPNGNSGDPLACGVIRATDDADTTGNGGTDTTGGGNGGGYGTP